MNKYYWNNEVNRLAQMQVCHTPSVCKKNSVSVKLNKVSAMEQVTLVLS